MSVTWGQIKLETLKKMDPSITSLVRNRNTKDYLNAIVPVANRGLQDLATAGKFIIKEKTIAIPDLKNLLTDTEDIVQHINEDISYTSDNAKAYYFEISGKGTVEIKVGNVVAKTITSDKSEDFDVYKGKINNPLEENVTITFKGPYPYLFRNVALYNVNFEEDSDVWEYSRNRRFDMREMVDDFFRLFNQDMVLESNNNSYEKYRSYEWEGDSTLILDGTRQGVYTIHYYAYPQTITEDTEDDYILSLDPEVANLLPLYMAAELYEDDDLDQAFYFREQYEEAKQKLLPTVIQGKPQFIDRWGW